MSDPVHILTPTWAEWEAWKTTELAKLGVTYLELRRQAQSGRFRSREARTLWLMIGCSTCRPDAGVNRD